MNTVNKSFERLSSTLHQTPLSLNIEATSWFIPRILSPISAGFPSPATEYMESGLDINAYLVENKAASFLFEVRGSSMIGAGIMDRDKVVVDRSIEARHGHIVVAAVNGEFTIKRLHKRLGCIELRAENPAYGPLVFSEDTELEIWGVVTGVVRKY